MNKFLNTVAAIASVLSLTLAVQAEPMTVPEGAKTYTIILDPGGNLREYGEHAEALKAAGVRVEVRGGCYSACGIYLLPEYGVDVCIDGDAFLGFHSPFVVNPEDHTINMEPWAAVHSAEVEWMFKFAFPEHTRKYLLENDTPSVYRGDLPSDMFIVPYEILSLDFPDCE